MEWLEEALNLKLADVIGTEMMTVQWHPALPVGKLKKMKTPQGRKPFIVTKSYLEATRDELRRYYADIERELGSDFKRPVFVEHRIEEAPEELHASKTTIFNDDGELVARKNGRRNGDILDLEVRKFDPKDPTNPDSPNAKDWLFFKVDWLPKTLRAILDQELQDISVNIQPKYTDPETGISYGPFLLEISETVQPVIKTIDLQSTMDPQVLESLGLRLADDFNTEDDMTPEQLEALMAALEQIAGTQKQMLEMLMKMGGEGEGDDEGAEAGDKVEAGDEGDDGDDDPAPAKTTKVEAGDDGDEPTEASTEAMAAVLSDLQSFAETQKEMNEQIKRFVSKGALFSDPGNSDPESPKAKVSKLSEGEAWAKAEEQLKAELGVDDVPVGKISHRCGELLAGQ